MAGSSAIRVLIQAEVGSFEKTRYDEKSLTPMPGNPRVVARAYPYAYGFVVATTAADGDNLDCYVLSDAAISVGSIVDCEIVGLLGQIESGEEDHKVLAVLAGDEPLLPDRAHAVLEEFILAVFAAYPSVEVSVGPIRSTEDAVRYVSGRRDDP